MDKENQLVNNVNIESDEYKEFKYLWKKCRDTSEGQERLHENSTLYLRKLSGQTDDEYASYLDRTLFYNATQRTVDAMRGLLFRKEPIYEGPDSISNWVDDIDLDGNSLNAFTEKMANEILITGGYGILVEHPTIEINDDNSNLTKFEAEKNNIRPFLAGYPIESIINWRISRENNQNYISMIVLKEIHSVHIDEFKSEDVIHYRVLDLEEYREGEQNQQVKRYRQRLFKEFKDNHTLNNQSKAFTLVNEPIYPLKNGQHLDFIPFYITRSNGLTYQTQKPPILDLVNVNLSHYKTTADLEHAAHYTGLPTAVVTGHTLEENSTLKIGSQTAWVFSEPEAKAAFLEFSGQGLGALEKRIDKKESQMATLGARLLANDSLLAESYETHLIKRQGEHSALASIANSIDKSIVKALKVMMEWADVLGEITYKINTDFIPNRLNSRDILALFQVYQGGGISFDDFIRNLKEGEIIPADKTSEDIKSEIEKDGLPIGADFTQQTNRSIDSTNPNDSINDDLNSSKG